MNFLKNVFEQNVIQIEQVKLEGARSAPPTGARTKTSLEKRQKQSQGIVD